jgi:hypothetical protein
MYVQEKFSGNQNHEISSPYVGFTPIYNICGTDFPNNIKVVLHEVT